MLESHIAVTLPPTQLRGSQSAKGVGGDWYEEHGIFNYLCSEIYLDTNFSAQFSYKGI